MKKKLLWLFMVTLFLYGCNYNNEDEIILESIKITKTPEKTTYKTGEMFDPSGMVVKALFSNGKEEIITEYKIDTPDVLLLNDSKVLISYVYENVTKEVELPIIVLPYFSIDYENARTNYGEFIIVAENDLDTYELSDGVLTLSPTAEKCTYTISGYFNGQIINNTKNTIIKLDNVFIENSKGEPVIYGTKKTEISSTFDSTNYIVSYGDNSGKIGAISIEKGLELGGSGTVYVSGNITHGIKAGDIKVKGNGTYYIQGTSKGSALNGNTFLSESGKDFNLYLLNSKNGMKFDQTIEIGSGNFYFSDNTVCFKTDRSTDDDIYDHYINIIEAKINLHCNDMLYQTEEDKYSVTEAVEFFEY